MSLLSPERSIFYAGTTIQSSINELLKSIKQIKSALGYFKTVISKRKIEVINENIFIIIDLIIELDKKVIGLVPELLSNRDEYSDHKLIRGEMYTRLAAIVKFGDRLLVNCSEYELQNAMSENLIFDYLIEAIEDYVEEIKKSDTLVNNNSVEELSIDENDHNATTSNQSASANNSNNVKPSSMSELSWCDDEHDIWLLKRRGFIRELNSSRGSKANSKESGFSSGSYDSDLESSIVETSDFDILLLQSTWKQFVSSRNQDSCSSMSSPRITFRPSFSLPSKGKEIVFGSNYTVDFSSSRARLTIDDTEVVLRPFNGRDHNILNDEYTDTIVPEIDKSVLIQPVNANLIEYESAEEYLWMKNDASGTKFVQGATVDALIVYACNNKQSDYTDAFITTYKSFIGSKELLTKLIYRFEYFINKNPGNANNYRIAKKTFALLIIIVNELVTFELSTYFLEFLIDCTYRIITLSEIKLGRLFRQYVTGKIFEFNNLAIPTKKTSVVDVVPITVNYTNILDIKPEILAQQICLMTHEIINNIRSSELLLYIEKQDIEIAPNFSMLANHYNSISFWAATIILKENEPKNRIRLMLYFIRVMRKLLDYKNYESCAALNSTFCNVSIYRILPDLKQLDEFIELFDPMKNFKIYRERINDVKGPCIPILFILIRDIIHIEHGSPNELHGLINFGKRYQIFNTLAKFRNAKTNPYTFQKNGPVLNFVNNFRDYWNEDKLIEKSYAIKPRGKDEEFLSDNFFKTLIKCVE